MLVVVCISRCNLSPGDYTFQIKAKDNDSYSDIKNTYYHLTQHGTASGWAKTNVWTSLIAIIYIIVIQVRHRYRAPPYAISPKDTTLLLLKMPHRVLWAFIKEEHSVRSEILAVTVFMKQRITAWARVELSS